MISSQTPLLALASFTFGSLTRLLSPLVWKLLYVPYVTAFRWVGINISNKLCYFYSGRISDSRMKVQVGYSRKIENRGKYYRKALCKSFSFLRTLGSYSSCVLSSIEKERYFYFMYSVFSVEQIHSFSSFMVPQ